MTEYYEFQNFAGKNDYLPSMIFYYGKSLLGQNFFLIVKRFSKFLLHILGKTKRQPLKRKYFSYI